MFIKKSKPKIITVYFGVPGSGKTTLAALQVRKALKNKETVFSNVPIIGTYKYNPAEDLGDKQIEDCLMILDEASIEFNNRNYKSFPKPAIEFFKLHRHYGVAINVFSQSYEDMDVTIRRLATRFVIVRKSVNPGFIATREAKKVLFIEEDQKQFVDGYEWRPLSRRWHWMPKAWPLFDSYEAPTLKDSKWKMWTTTSREVDS